MHSAARPANSASIGQRINQSHLLHPHSPRSDQELNHSPQNQSLPQQTSLPSIRHLHPYLPPSGMASLSGESSTYNYQTSPQFSSNTSDQSNNQIDNDTSGPQRESSGNFGAGDSEHEGDPQGGPAKKKRRRQALSCTECKRRKIKCDRAQPCGPCIRRGEQAKCQWHIIEPIEKYVTRAEYDELKARFDQLETVVSQLFSTPSSAMSMPSYQMGMHAPMQGTSTPAAVPTYHQGPSSGQIAYQGMVPSSAFPQQNQQPQQHLDLSPRYHKPDSPREATSPRHAQTLNGRMAPPSGSPTIPTAHPPSSLSRLRSPPELKSPASPHKQQSPLSLASITSPYNSESQSKNYRAQTLKLGERLRPGYPSHEDPAMPSNSGQIQSGPQRPLARLICS